MLENTVSSTTGEHGSAGHGGELCGNGVGNRSFISAIANPFPFKDAAPDHEPRMPV